MPFKSKLQQRYMHFLKEKGKLPKSVNLDEYDEKTDFKHLPEEKMAFGGEVEADEGWEDDGYNDHSDTSGEPFYYMAEGGQVDSYGYPVKSGSEKPLYDTSGYDAYKTKKAFGGEIEAPEHGDEGHPEMPMEEVQKHLAMALKRRKQLKPGA